jgi:hypothetical protein
LALTNSTILKMKRFYAFAVLAAPLITSCAILESSGGPRVEVSATTAPLDVSVGDTVRITINVRNLGDNDVTLGTPGCNMDFLISDLDGNAYVPAELVYCTLELRAPIVLSRGETHQVNAFTTGRVIPQGSQEAPAMLSPGTYRLRPVVSVFSGDQTAVVVSADPVLVTFR